MNLPAIQRIQLSDEFLLPTWETPAFTELCGRVEPISPAEAEVLGMARFVEIARIREAERTRWVIGFAKGVNEDLQQSGNPSSCGQDNPDYSSNRTTFPTCNCSVKVGNPAAKPPVPHTVNHCDLHKVAPKVLEEGKQLLKQRNELNQQLRNMRSATQSRLENGVSSFKLDAPDLKAELTKAPWFKHLVRLVAARSSWEPSTIVCPSL
ncbi:hypothetical protein B0J17DRAFT_371376 [Rhizoctonia solani]|nr:hypothetical protein B0J17DRAFT_371376 [Rhizoctonia solani]